MFEVNRTAGAGDVPGDFGLVEELEDQLNTYDEALYYMTKEYISTHGLHHKQQRRSEDVEFFPWRYQMLQIWRQPLNSRAGIVYFLVQCVLVVATLVQLMYESSPRYNTEIHPEFGTLWLAVEMPIALLFTIDLIAHFFLLPPTPNDFSRQSRKGFFKRYDTWLDILTILPSVFAVMEASGFVSSVRDVDFLKAIRVLRFTRVVRQFHTVDQLAHTLEKSFEPLLGPFIFLFVIGFTLSAAIFYAERGEYDPLRGQFLMDDCDCLMSAPRAVDPNYPCPKKPSQFTSVASTIWFVIVTMTTVGYGDIVPLCWTGRSLTAVAMLLGNVLTAMPIAIVGTYYTNIVMANRRRQKGDSARAFGTKKDKKSKKRQSMQDSLGLETGLLDDIDEEAATTTIDSFDNSSVSARKYKTQGERMAQHLASKDITFDLLKPPNSVIHHVNAYVKQELEAIVDRLRSKEGALDMISDLHVIGQPVLLELQSAPPVAALPKAFDLTEQIEFSVGIRVPDAMQNNCDIYLSANAQRAEGLPAQLFSLTLCPLRNNVSLTAIFPAHISINGNACEYNEPTRLLVGDIITIHRSKRDGDSLSYQFIRGEGQSAAASSGVVSGESRETKTLPPTEAHHPVIEISEAVDPDRSRHFTFSAFTPTFDHVNAKHTGRRAQDPFDFRDL